MSKCPYDGNECRGTIGCDLGACAKEVDDKMVGWAKKYGWDE